MTSFKLHLKNMYFHEIQMYINNLDKVKKDIKLITLASNCKIYYILEDLDKVIKQVGTGKDNKIVMFIIITIITLS